MTSLIRFLSFLSLLSFVQQVIIIITIFISISKCHDANESLIWTNDPHLVYRRFWIWDADILDWVQVAYNMNFTAIVRYIYRVTILFVYTILEASSSSSPSPSTMMLMKGSSGQMTHIYLADCARGWGWDGWDYTNFWWRWYLVFSWHYRDILNWLAYFNCRKVMVAYWSGNGSSLVNYHVWVKITAMSMEFSLYAFFPP